MVLARRLLSSSSGSGSFVVPAHLRTVTSASQGGAIVVNTPWAVYYNGKVYVAYVRGDNGNIEIVSHDVASSTTSSAFVLHAAYEVDNHAAPSICVLASGHIVVAYSKHNAAPINIRVSTNAEDITAWDSEQVQGHGPSTYCNLLEMSAEGKLYLFYRWIDPALTPETSQVYYITSTDGGSTWSADAPIYEVLHASTYWHIVGNGVNRIDFVATDLVPSSTSNASLGHFYMTGGNLYKTDGTLISAARPIGFTDITKIIDGPTVGGGCFPFDISPTGPTVAVNVYLTGGTNNAFYDVRYTGGSWSSHLIANSGGVFYGQQSPGLSLDRANPDAYICSIKVGSDWQMFAYSSGDNGVTWAKGAQITSTSSPTVHVWPQSVVDHSSGLTWVWLEGTYTTDSSWATGVAGYG